MIYPKTYLKTAGPYGIVVFETNPGVRVPVALSSDLQSAPPEITGQTELTTLEETALAITISNVQVTDPDSDPSSFTLTLSPGDNYTLDGNTVIPAEDFVGTLTVPAVVNDGTNNSEPYGLQVSVSNVNDAPQITGQMPLSTPENQAVAIDVGYLTIMDPDNSTFTLSILAGEGYTVAGNIVTPSTGFSGDLTVPVFVSDGELRSNDFSFVITVTAVNDAPVITGQREIVIAEETSVALALSDVTVSDPDNSFPDDFTLAVLSGENYTAAGNVVTPDKDFTGELAVNVVINDGSADSQPFPMEIVVTPVNDAPVITGQADVTTGEESARTILLTDLIVSDPDNDYPGTFALTVFSGNNYTVEGNSILPVIDYVGPLTVPVQVSDGELTSNVFNLNVVVTAVNDKPVITGQVPVQTEEDAPFTIKLSHLEVLDTDNSYPTGFSLSVVPGSNYTVNGTTVQPVVNFTGTLNVSVTVSDGVDSSDPFTFQILVGVSNDAPLITGQTALSTNEEQPVTLSLSHLIVEDPDNVYPNGFTLLVSPGTNYTVTDLTVTPALNFAGTLTIPVRVNDGINNSPTFDLQLQVNQINDPPSFAAIPNQQVDENSPSGSVVIRDISKGPREGDQQLTFVATSGNTNVIEDPVIQYDGTGRTAVLSYTIKPNTSGVVTITVVAIDNGSNSPPHQNSYSSSFQVEVREINDAPTLEPLTNISILEDAEQQNVPLNGISAGPGESQTINVTVETNKPTWFDLLQVAYTSPSATGLVQFKTKANIHGTAEITVTATDNGSGVAPHSNTIKRTFKVTIQPVNDAPVFSSQPKTVAVVGESYQYDIAATDPDGDKIAYTSPTKPAWASLSGNNGSVRLAGKPPQGSLGDFPVTIVASDGTSSVEQSFKIYVNVRPALQNLNLATEEDTPFAFPANFFMAGYSDQNETRYQAFESRPSRNRGS